MTLINALEGPKMKDHPHTRVRLRGDPLQYTHHDQIVLVSSDAGRPCDTCRCMLRQPLSPILDRAH
ncbi:unnamed protein product [Ectocarpus sp. 12 AP-2014]